jgi:hypothetical protein
MILRDAHQSGHAIALAVDDLAALQGIANAATVGVLTEAVGVKMLDGWASVGHETRVVYDEARWQLMAQGVESAPTPAWKRGRSPRTSVEFAWALLRHKRTGVTLLRVGGHLPAHLYKPSQRRATEAALTALGPLILRLDAQYDPAVITASFDFNRDLTRASQRKLIEDSVAGTGLRLVAPPKSTLGRRTIDGYLTNGPLAAVRMLPRVHRYDHRGSVLACCACPIKEKK